MIQDTELHVSMTEQCKENVPNKVETNERTINNNKHQFHKDDSISVKCSNVNDHEQASDSRDDQSTTSIINNSNKQAQKKDSDHKSDVNDEHVAYDSDSVEANNNHHNESSSDDESISNSNKIMIEQKHKKQNGSKLKDDSDSVQPN
jgi:hypothetical protein